jgi:uncharacterized protein YeaO (DUF488 family)
VSVAENVRLKRVYEPASPDDGHRLLVTRYWPRGQPKSVTDEYLSRIAPSKKLIDEYRKGPLSWDEFTRRYRQELLAPEAQQELKRLAALARSQRLTLMCMCPDDWNCHRTILRDAIIDSVESP